jgi:hypothetical protein
MAIQTELLKALARLGAQRRDRDILTLFRRKLKILESDDPELAHELSRTISSAGGVGSMRRFERLDQYPTDADTGLELLSVERQPRVQLAPILDGKTNDQIERFLRERQHVDDLRRKGIRPPTSLALMGPPGTGKTTLARWIAEQLGVPLMVLNLASVITSYLGQTGHNIKKALDAARVDPAVILLDEFDALGRIRTDDNDVGEMKRVVTVLLQEIEQWPDHSVLVAATNLPELVDVAFRRRFSRWLRLRLPEADERFEILKAHYGGQRYVHRHLRLAAVCLDGASGADLASFAERVMTREVVDGESPVEAVLSELAAEITERRVPPESRKLLVQLARGIDRKKYTYRVLGNLLGVSHTTVRKLAMSA